MPLEKEYYRHLLRFFYDKKVNAAAAWREITNVYGEDAVSHSTCERWYKAYANGRQDVVDKPRSGRPVKIDSAALHAALATDPGSSVREISSDLPCSYRSVARHLHALGYTKKSPRQDPHELTEIDKKRRVTLCKELLAKRQEGHFIERVVTSDEKWIAFSNPMRRNLWVQQRQKAFGVPKTNFRQTKRMLCVWWNCTGIIHWELLRRGQTVNTDLYCSQLERAHAALRNLRPALVNRKQVLYIQDNATPHKSKRTTQKIQSELGWELLNHPAYSPDLAPSDYHLFRSIEHFLRGRRFNDDGQVEIAVRQFFESKPDQWYRRGIELLLEKWKKAIDAKGEYFA